MQDAVTSLSALIVQHRRPHADAAVPPTSTHQARAFLLDADALLRPRPVLCSWFADACGDHCALLPNDIRFLAVAVLLSCAPELPLCMLDSAKSLLPQCDPPPRDILSLLHWQCIVSVAGVMCVQHGTQPSNALACLCEHASDCALGESVSEAISATAAAPRTASFVLRQPSSAVFDWGRSVLVQTDGSAQLSAWLLRSSPSDGSFRTAHDVDTASQPCTEHGQTSSCLSLPSLHPASLAPLPVSAHLRAHISSALRCTHQSLSAVALSHRSSCSTQQFVDALCECVSAEAQRPQPFDASSCLPSISDFVDLVHDAASSHCPSITLPLARALATHCGGTADVWMCVHRCMLCPSSDGLMQVAAAVDLGVTLAPPAPLARLTHLSERVDASVHACWTFACACMQQQLDVDLNLLPSTLISLSRTFDAAAVAAALLCRAGQWLCVCSALQFQDSSSASAHESLSRCIDVVMMALQALTSRSSTPAMTFLSHVHDAWRAAVATASENDDAVLDCVPPYLSLFSLAAGSVAFANVYGPNVANDVKTLIAAAISMVPRLRPLLSGWMKRCRFDSSHTLFAALRDAGVVCSVQGGVSHEDARDSRECSAAQSSDTMACACPQTPPRPDRAAALPLAYRLTHYQSPSSASQMSPSASSPLHKSTVAMLDRVLQRFSDDPATLPVDAAKFSLQVKSFDSWRHMVAAVAAPQSSAWAAANLALRCQFVHALMSSSLPGSDAATPHLAAWVVGSDRSMDSDVLHSIVTTWARSSMLLDCHSFCVWALRQAQALPGTLSSFQSLQKATMTLQPMLNAPSMMSAMSAEMIARSLSVPAAARMLALVFTSGYSLDALLLHRSELSFGFFDESHNVIGGNGAAAALNSHSLAYLCIHGVVGAALVVLHEDDALAPLLCSCSHETRRFMTHRICFYVLRCLSMTTQSLKRCNIPVLLSLASAIARDVPHDAELPENVAAAERLFRLCSVLQPLHIQHGEEAINLLRLSRCHLISASVENLCSSCSSHASAAACTEGMLGSAWDASWLASMIAACRHEWGSDGAERVLSLLGLQLQLGCLPDLGVCARLTESQMLHSAIKLMQQRRDHPGIDHIANIALQLFCRRTSQASAFFASTADGLEAAASLASLCACFCEGDCAQQLSLLLCMVACALVQQLQLEHPEPCGMMTKVFDEHSSKSCWRGLYLAASRNNLALAAAAGFSSGAVLIAQLLRLGASFAAALTLLQPAPACAFASFSPQFAHAQTYIFSNVKAERHPDEDSKADASVAEIQPSLHHSAAVERSTASTDFVESCDVNRSVAHSTSNSKRQLVMHGSADRSTLPSSAATHSLLQDANTKQVDDAAAVASPLPKKRLEVSQSPGAAKHQSVDHSVQKRAASIDSSSSKPLSWLAQLRAQKSTANHEFDDIPNIPSTKCDPVQSASPAVLRIASAALGKRGSARVESPAAGVGAFMAGSTAQAANHSTGGGESDDDIVALS